ncbi:uncharacterized protein LOC112154438 [Oryzias melastigma]|uniref:uncharacterized protein LOC112154438 n=1 Tax=Oryzias melastigma TaxID=30732 RepID=UPI000CF81BB0|nr:uncharacterized protein LOC112154438 [Oryzias melastigma]
MQASDLCRIIQAVMKPLENGLLSFNRLSEMILSIDADIVFHKCQTFDDFRQEVQKMEKYLKESEQKAGKELEQLDEKTETLTVKKYNLERKRKDQDAELARLKTCVESHQSTLKSCTEARDAEKRNLETAKETLKEMQDKVDHADTIRNIGVPLFVIPVFGWIAGGIMVGVGCANVSSATEEVIKAQEEVQKCDSQIKVYTAKVSHYNGLIFKAEQETKKVNSRICATKAELEGLLVKRKTVENLQSQTRKVVHHLGLLSGRVSVVETQTRTQILVQTIMRVMDELTPVLTQIIEDDMLPTGKLERMIEEMKTNNRKLKASLSEESNDYY